MVNLKTFPENSIYTVLKKNRDLKEILSRSLYTNTKNEKKYYVIKNCGNCDICKNYLISDDTFNNDFDCNCINVVYLISCTYCNEQYVDYAVDF